MSKADKKINKLEKRNVTYNSQTCNVDNKNPHINDPAIYIHSDSDTEQQLNTTQSNTNTYSTAAIDTKVMSSLHISPNTGLHSTDTRNTDTKTRKVNTVISSGTDLIHVC